MTDSTVNPPAAPSWLSPEARAGLEVPITRTPYPPLDDSAAWQEFIGQVDTMVTGMLAGMPSLAESALIDADGVPTYVVTPPGAPTGDDAPVFLNIHGGGLIMGAGDLTRVMTEIGAAGNGVVNWAPDYRMPPLHPFPAALDDVATVYRALLAVKSPDAIVVGGGSAGGNLAAALLLRAKDEGLPMPAALVLNTPEVDLTESGDSFTTLADVSVGLQSLREANLLYAGGHALDEPYLSPLFGDLTGFPPTLLTGGTRDLFLSNTVRMHRRLREAGVDADLHIFDGRPHAGFGNAPEELAVTLETRSFVHRHLGLG
ncbi:alpha/beta hydrolase fold domain-containing protein [Herbiconiux sp.]|uniref:alpha/beta hydrolase fold domain-containing protein n=1 Tax=Herbiconiux sp. TaxID=1871186 RepID=UPI0025BAE9DB|nr:alpha/beta hydrolase fold domain-containing protein [Herbiconiux sp.]